jgi:hypothetical protein
MTTATLPPGTIVCPRWERGYRSHGYWVGNIRIGWIGLEKPATAYAWEAWTRRGYADGKSRTLKQAKLQVEKIVRAQSWEMSELESRDKAWK